MARVAAPEICHLHPHPELRRLHLPLLAVVPAASRAPPPPPCLSSPSTAAEGGSRRERGSQHLPLPPRSRPSQIPWRPRHHPCIFSSAAAAGGGQAQHGFAEALSAPGHRPQEAAPAHPRGQGRAMPPGLRRPQTRPRQVTNLLPVLSEPQPVQVLRQGDLHW